MPRYFTHYWKQETREDTRVLFGEPMSHTASNSFWKRGVDPGDFIYVVSLREGALYLVGKMCVKKVVSMSEAKVYFGEDVWDAEDHAIASEATAMDFDRQLPFEIVDRLEFVAETNRNVLYEEPGRIHRQTIRGVRELAETSAGLLDSLLDPLEPVDYTVEEEDVDTILQETLLSVAEAVLDEVTALSRGQSYSSSPEHRRAVELHAMAVAINYFVDLDYDVVDKSATKPYDLMASKGEEQLYVEVKGTTSPGEQVFLTANEVEWAREHKDQMVLFVVSGIEVEEGAEGLKASGEASLVLVPWDVDAGELKALTYRYGVPGRG